MIGPRPVCALCICAGRRCSYRGCVRDNKAFGNRVGSKRGDPGRLISAEFETKRSSLPAALEPPSNQVVGTPKALAGCDAGDA